MFIPYRFPSSWDDNFFLMTAGYWTVPLWISTGLVIASMTVYALHKLGGRESAKRHTLYIRAPIISFIIIYALQPVLYPLGYASGFGKFLGHLIFTFMQVAVYAVVPLGVYWLVIKLPEKGRKLFFFVTLIILALGLPAHIGFVYYKMASPKCCPPAYSDGPFGSYTGPPNPSALHAFFDLPQPGHQPRTCKICDASESLTLLTNLAEDGNAEAQVHLGGGYERGSFVAQDKRMAVHWYSKAAEQGNFNGIWHLSKFYFEGPEEQKNYVEAAKWYKKGLEIAPSAHVYFKLSQIYAEGGYGVTPDYIEAYFWYLQAEKFHLKDEARKESILKNIPEEKRKSIQDKARDWLFKHHRSH